LSNRSLRSSPFGVAIAIVVFLGILLILWLLLPLWVLFIQWNTAKIKDEIRNLIELERGGWDEKGEDTAEPRRMKDPSSSCLLLWIPLAHSRSLPKIPLYIHDKEIRVEVAQTPEERMYGLMGRKHLGRDEGMLFIFETEDYHGFG